MDYKHSSDDLIETLVSLHYGMEGSPRERHLLRESLRNLVRLARVEMAENTLRARYPHMVMPNENALH